MIGDLSHHSKFFIDAGPDQCQILEEVFFLPLETTDSKTYLKTTHDSETEIKGLENLNVLL